MSKLVYMANKYPVLITSVHEYPHKRSNVEDRYRQGEENTLKIAKAISKKLNCGLFSIEEQSEFDPNFEINKPFVKKLNKIITDRKLELVMDIHGLSPKRSMDILIFRDYRFAKSRNYSLALRDFLHLSKDFRHANIQIMSFKKDREFSICSHINTNYRIPALQLEISQDIRMDTQLRNALIKDISKWVVETIS